jgi:hypothetical protein
MEQETAVLPHYVEFVTVSTRFTPLTLQLHSFSGQKLIEPQLHARTPPGTHCPEVLQPEETG